MALQYVALGSSYAAGPGLGDRVRTRPRQGGQTRHNYPHLVAARLVAELIDVTSSGATTLDLLETSQFGQRPQVEALTPSTGLVTITAGGNDVGYIPGVSMATLPSLVRRLPRLRAVADATLDPQGFDDRLAEVGPRLVRLVQEVHRRSPEARVLLVDYLTLLPPEPMSAMRGLSADEQRLLRSVGDRLAAATAEATTRSDAELVTASRASLDHHAWSADPWTTSAAALAPWREGAPFHPNRTGMRVVADLVVDAIMSGR